MCFKWSPALWAGLWAAVFPLRCLAMNQVARRQSCGSRLKVTALEGGRRRAWLPYEHVGAIEPFVRGFDLWWEEVGGRLWRDVSWNLRSTAVLVFAVAPGQNKHTSSTKPGATSLKNPLQQILFSKRFIHPTAAHYTPTPPQARGIKMYGSTFISTGGTSHCEYYMTAKWFLHPFVL